MTDSYDEEFVKYLQLSNQSEEYIFNHESSSQDYETDNIEYINPSFNLLDFVELVIMRFDIFN